METKLEAAKKKIEEQVGREESKRQAALQREVKKLQKQNRDADKKMEAKLEAAKKKIEEQVGREESKRQAGLQREVKQLQKQNRDLARRLEHVDPPHRGAAHEAAITDRFIEGFPDDEITRKGKVGDIVQKVRYSTGHDHELVQAGVILYECKDTKRWSNRFLSQIKADGQKRRTRYLLLVSRELPAGENAMCVRDDVIVSDTEHAVIMARILRGAVIEAHREGVAGRDRALKTARLYEYLRGDEFRGELTDLVDAGGKLKKMLDKERGDHERVWVRRQQKYDELAHNSVAIEEAIRAIIESETPPRAARPAKAKPRRSRDHTHASP